MLLGQSFLLAIMGFVTPWGSMMSSVTMLSWRLHCLFSLHMINAIKPELYVTFVFAKAPEARAIVRGMSHLFSEMSDDQLIRPVRVSVQDEHHLPVQGQRLQLNQGQKELDRQTQVRSRCGVQDLRGHEERARVLPQHHCTL